MSVPKSQKLIVRSCVCFFYSDHESNDTTACWIEQKISMKNRISFLWNFVFTSFFFSNELKWMMKKNFQSTFWHTRAPRLLNRLAVRVEIEQVFVPVAIPYLFRNITLWNSIDNALSRFRCRFWPIPLFDISCRFLFSLVSSFCSSSASWHSRCHNWQL